VTEKKNCWEIKDCGREPNGHAVHELGICPAAKFEAYDGANGGTNAGRVCWSVAGTFCWGTVQGVFAAKIESCLKCPFFRQVATEEDLDFVLRPEEEISVIKKS
jgi:hypothetical protein